MEVKEFVKNIRRMCNCYDVCDKKCELYNPFCVGHIIRIFSDEEIESVVDLVEKWAKENPIETNQDRILKLFPNAIITANGVFDLCPKVLDAKHNCIGNYVSKDGIFERDCLGCKNEFWNNEYKEK